MDSTTNRQPPHGPMTRARAVAMETEVNSLLPRETKATYGTWKPLASLAGGRQVAQRAGECGAARQRSRGMFYPGSGRREA